MKTLDKIKFGGSVLVALLGLIAIILYFGTGSWLVMNFVTEVLSK